MRNTLRSFLATILMLGSCLATAQTIAFLANLKGEVALDGNPRPMLLAELSRGQKLSLGKGAAASVMFIASGKEYLLKGPGEFQVKDTEMSGSSPMPPAVRNTEWRTSNKILVQVAQASAASVRMRSIAKPRDEKAVRLLYPTEGSVSTLQPTLRWQAPESKQPGEVSVQALGEEKAAHVGKAPGSSYRLPAKLKPDTEYAWTYAREGHELASGRFRTVSLQTMQELDQRRPSERAEFSDRVLFALMLQEAGAIQEAQEAWARLAKERTDLPELAALAK